jgi:hypothetical protein
VEPFAGLCNRSGSDACARARGPPAQASESGETLLPAGGGDPGKVWDAFDAAMRGGDVAAVKKLIIKSRVQDVMNELWKSAVMLEFRKFKDPVYVSGVMRSGNAELRYKASETPAGRRNTREAHLQMEDGVWKVAGWE